jgi:hypothetical protein
MKNSLLANDFQSTKCARRAGRSPRYGGGGSVAGRGGAMPAPIGGGGKLLIDGACPGMPGRATLAISA